MEKIKKINSMLEKLGVGDYEDKVFYTQYNIGKAKYVVNYYDGFEKHKDGSPFFNIKIFKNKNKMNEFIEDLKSDGYKER